MVFVISWAWNLHRSLHQVHIDALTSSQVALGEKVEFSTCATLVFRYEAESTLVLSCGQLICTWPGITFSEVLET